MTTQAKLNDGTEVFCLQRSEALVLDHHIHGYLDHGIHIDPGHVVFDVGANIGLFGIRAFQQCKGDVTVYAFEPVPPTFAVLQQNFNKLGGRLKAMQIGLSSAPGEATFSYFPNSPALSTAHPEAWDDDPTRLEKAVRSNFVNPPPSFWWAKLVPDFVLKIVAKYLRSGAVSFQCTLKTVSQIIKEEGLQRIDLLKVDAEGAELEVLRGISPEDWPKIGAVVAEVHDLDDRLNTVRALLTSVGFSAITTEEEKGMEGTGLINVFARRSA